MDLDFFSTVVVIIFTGALLVAVVVCLISRVLAPNRIHSTIALNSCVTSLGTERCCVCMDGRANVILSCGHADLCLECTLKLTKCPFCRYPIASVRMTVLP